MKISKKVFVYMVLFLIFIAQIAFSGTVKADSKVNAGNVAQLETESQDETTSATEAAVMAAKTTEDSVDVVEANMPQIELNVEYKNSLTASGEIVDVLEDVVEDTDFANKAIAYCEARVTVYAEPDSTSEPVGCMYSRTQADILELGEEWSKISSGNVVGYVKNTYLLFGTEADKVAPFIGNKTTTVIVDELAVYASADSNSEVIATIYGGEPVTAYDEFGSWTMVECEAGYGYVLSSGIVSVYDLATAMTIEEEAAYIAELARIEAERIAAERAEQARIAAAQSQTIAVTQNEAMTVSDAELYLLACIIEWEAGWEPYEGKLAVANVVLNRVRSTKFRQNNITDVIYAPGQFTGVLDANGNISERFGALLAAGPTHDDCYTAAVEALAGINNIGDYCFFISVKKANYAKYIKYTIINNHCFYAY